MKLLLTVFFITLSLTPFSVWAEVTESEELTIFMTESGYQPVDIKIKPGTIVNFFNNGTADLWPASDNHPSHTLYDGTSLKTHCQKNYPDPFDSCGPIKPQGTWSFTFTETGSFDYHDHLWPHLKGEIIVIPAVIDSDSDRTTPFNQSFNRLAKLIIETFFLPFRSAELNDGDIRNENFTELKKKYSDLTINFNPKVAIESLKEESKSDGIVFALCHDLLHEIGTVAFSKYESFENAAVYQNDFCNSGYIHGVFEAHFTQSGDPLYELGQKCDSYAEMTGREFDLWQCHHGVGHGFMYMTGGDLTESLQLCVQNFSLNDVVSCQNGVYMEVFNQENLAHENEYIIDNNPFMTCKQQQYSLPDCYQYVPTYLSQAVGMEFSEMFAECNIISDQIYRGSCIIGIGAEAMKRSMDNPLEVFSMCEKSNDIDENRICVEGAVSIHMNQTGSYEETNQMCQSTPFDIKSICERVTASRKSDFEHKK